MTNPASKETKVPWQLLLKTALETWASFYIATFSLAVYFSFRMPGEIWTTVFMVLTYLFILVGITRHIISKLTLATLMLAIPIAPLLALISVVTLIPIIELLH